MKSCQGWTLLEVIIVIVIMAAAAAMFVSYMGSAYIRSPTSAGLVSDQYKLVQQMEILTSQYRQALQDGNGTIADLCAFKASCVDNLAIEGINIVDTAHTSCTYTLTDSTGTYTTAAGSALLVTLTYKNQTLQSIFTK